MSSLIIILLVAAWSVAPASPPWVGPADAGWERCDNEALGYTLWYPAGWHTNPPGEMGPCRLFHPEPFEVPYRAAIPLHIAVAIVVEPVVFGKTLGPDIGERVMMDEALSVAGRQARRILSESTGDGFLPDDVRAYRYHVAMNGSTLIAMAHDVGEGPFDLRREVLDAMMARLRIHS